MGILKSVGKYWWIMAILILVVFCILIAIRIIDAMNYHQNGIDF